MPFLSIAPEEIRLRMRTSVFRNAVDIFDEHVPGGFLFLDYLRRARADIRTFSRTFIPWRPLEDKISWLTLEVTNICNSNCRFCAYQHQGEFRGNRGVMSDAVFKKSLEEFVALGGKFVSYTPFVGEPLLDPRIIERISYAKSLGARTFMFTNGILFNRIDLEKFLKSGINILTVSTAPFDLEAYEILFRNKHYHDVVEGICQILFLRNRFRPDLTINIAFRSHVPMRQVLKLPDFRSRVLPLLSRKDLDALIVNTRGFDNWGGQIKKSDMIGIMRLAISPMLKYRPCAWTLWGPYVTFDGQVRACACRFAATKNRDSKDELWVGDITKSSLADIWFGDRVKNLHRRFTSCDLPVACQKCTMYRSC